MAYLICVNITQGCCTEEALVRLQVCLGEHSKAGTCVNGATVTQSKSPAGAWYTNQRFQTPPPHCLRGHGLGV